jgi:hypothetical protein
VVRRRALAPAVIGVALLACSCSDETTYPTTFTCVSGAGGNAACPGGQTCPTVPLGAGGCEDLPGAFGHPATKVEAGRVEGCRVGLSYGNPYYRDTQQECVCKKFEKTDAMPRWTCAI